MTAKSILEVDVSTAEFQRYKALFDQYTSQLQKQPALWAGIAKQHKQLQQQFRNTTEAVEDEHKKLEDLNKVNEANERRLDKSKGLWADMAGSSEKFAKNLTSASGFLSKWGGLIFGGLMGGAMFGIDRAVHDASSSRQQAMGLGVSIGELKAFSANFARIGDTGSLLSSVNTMETDPTKKQGWYALGLGNMTGNTVKDTMTLLDAERKFAQQTPLSTLGLMGEKLGLPSSPEQLRQMRDTTAPEWEKMKQGTLADIKRLDVPGAQSLQELETQLKRNMSSITSAFEKQLARAAPLLEKFSDALTRGTVGVINHTGDDVADWWKKLQRDPLGGALDFVTMPYRHAYTAAEILLGKMLPVPLSSGTVMSSPDAYRDYLGRRDMVAGLPKGLLEAIFQKESSGNLFPPNSPAGAIGPFQFMPATADAMRFNPYDPMQSAAGAEKLVLALMSEFHGDLDKALAAYNWKPSKVEEDVKEHGKDWLKFAPRETQDYVRKIELVIHNNTGGSATIAATQLAH